MCVCVCVSNERQRERKKKSVPTHVDCFICSDVKHIWMKCRLKTRQCSVFWNIINNKDSCAVNLFIKCSQAGVIGLFFHNGLLGMLTALTTQSQTRKTQPIADKMMMIK